MTVLSHSAIPPFHSLLPLRFINAFVVNIHAWLGWQLDRILCAMSQAHSSSDLTDEQLMAQYVDGCDGSFRTLFDRYAPKLYRAARRRGLSESESQDAVQQTFVHVHQGRAEFDLQGKVAPWIYTIGFNVMRDYGRRASAHWRMKTALRADPIATTSTEAPLDESMKDESHGVSESMIQRALAQLSNDQREVICLHYFEALSFVEIARVQGISSGAVRAKAHRGYEKLRTVLPGMQRSKGGPHE
jgi:RNA polymerase sigma factor (sigma-70 family)